MNVTEAHCNDDYFFMTLINTILIYLLYWSSFGIPLYRVWPAMMLLAPFLYPIEMGSQFQSPYVPFEAAHV
jgi:hypothetical protein